MKECHFLEYTILPNEILALIFEDHKIREHWPALNKSQKKQSLKFGLYAYENGKGEVKWVIQKANGNGALRKFGTYLSGQTWLANFLEEVKSNPIDDLEVLKNLKQSLQKSWIVALDEGGAVFIENGNLTGIYIEDDFLHQKEWVRKHFINIQPSPILNSIGQKLIEQQPNNVIEI